MTDDREREEARLERLVSLLRVAWDERPRDRDTTGLRVTVDPKKLELRYQIARAPKESGHYFWREYGVDYEAYQRILRGSEPGPFAESDEAPESTARLREAAEGVPTPVLEKEMKLAMIRARDRIPGWLVLTPWNYTWRAEHQARFEEMNPRWHPGA